MNSEKPRLLKAVGYLKLFIQSFTFTALYQKFESPLIFLVCQLSFCTIYFSDIDNWWLLVLFLQTAFCLVGIMIASWRAPSIILLSLLFFFNLSWFNPGHRLADECNNKIDTLIGTVKSDSHKKSKTIDLIRCSVFCKGEKTNKAIVRLVVDPRTKRYPKYFRPGDLIEIKNVRIVKESMVGLSILPTDRFRVYNLSSQEQILNRNQLLVFIQAKAEYYLEGFSLSVFKSLLTADRSNLSQHWKLVFKQLGVFHVFAISGMHIGILFLWLTFILRKITSFSTVWILKGYGILVCDFASVFLIFLFLLMIGMPISAERAALMLLWWLVIKHFLFWQPISVILIAIALIILVKNPAVIGQISFQLSFLSVAGILAILPVLPITMKTDSILKKIAKYSFSTFSISFWLLLFTLPIVQKLTEHRSLLAPFNNLVHIAFISLVFLPLLLIVLVFNLLAFYFSISSGEIVLYSVVHLVSRFWEEILKINFWANTPFLIKIPVTWSALSQLLYWLSLLVIAFLLSKLNYRTKNLDTL